MSKNKKLVPKRRFKEFQNTDAWEQRELGEVVDMFNGDRGINYPNVGDIVEFGIPFINAGDLQGGRVNLSSSNKITREKFNQLGGAKIQLGDIIYCLRGTLGKNAFVDNFTEGTVASSLVVLRPKSIVGKYLFQILNSDIEYRQRILCDEGAAQPNLSAKNLSLFSIPVPSRDEQEKLSTFFTNLDQTIAFQQRKLEKMKSMKSAYLSEMFPAEGERKPKRRFPGFTDDWEQRELGELFKFQYGEGNTIPNDDGIYPVYGAGGQQGYYSKYNAENSIIIGHMGDAGAVSWAEGKHFVTYNGTITTSKLDDFPVRFGYYLLLNSDLRKLTGGSSLKFLTYEMISSIYTQIPKSENERIEIANLFHQLDQIIAFQQQKLEKLQNIKKAYLNEMFI